MNTGEIYHTKGRGLAAKVRTLPPGEAERLIANANAAVEELRGEVTDALDRYLTTMTALLAKAQGMPSENENELLELYDVAFEAKGLAGTFDYPLLSEIGESLRCYLQKIDAAQAREFEVIEHYVRSMSAVLRDNRRGDGGKIGHAILESLEKITKKGAMSGHRGTTRR